MNALMLVVQVFGVVVWGLSVAYICWRVRENIIEEAVRRMRDSQSRSNNP